MPSSLGSCCSSNRSLAKRSAIGRPSATPHAPVREKPPFPRQKPRRMGKAQRAHHPAILLQVLSINTGNDPDGHGLRPFAHPTPNWPRPARMKLPQNAPGEPSSRPTQAAQRDHSSKVSQTPHLDGYPQGDSRSLRSPGEGAVFCADEQITNQVRTDRQCHPSRRTLGVHGWLGLRAWRRVLAASRREVGAISRQRVSNSISRVASSGISLWRIGS